jgi:serine protease Do
MSVWKTAALAAGAAAAAAGAVLLAPGLRGQEPRGRDTSQMVRIAVGSGVRLGVRVRDVDEDDVKREKLPSPAGVVVEDVHRDSPAEKGGLKAGDVVVEFDGERVRSARQFARLVDETPEGKEVQAVVLRDGQRVTLELRPEPRRAAGFAFDPAWSARMAELAAERAATALEHHDFDVPPMPVFGPRGALGVRVQELTPQLADYFGVKDGVLVASVEPGSPAEKAGLKAGDVVTAVDGAAVTEAAALRRELRRAAADRDRVEIEITRDRKSLRVTVPLERPARARRARPTVER